MTDVETPKSLFEALARFQADLPKINKGRTADTGKYQYDYADLADVSDAVLKRIGALGMFFTAWPHHREEDGKFGLSFTLGHVSGERQDGWWELRSDLPMQQMGGMITYARRYCLLAVTGAAPAGDDDDAASTQDVPSRQTAGDAWEDATPARPGQQLRAVPAEGENRPWPEIALEKAKAGKFRSEAEGWALWREAAAKHIAGDCTREDQDEIQNRVASHIKGRRKEAAARILKPLPADDAWRDKILDDLASDEEARGALAEIQQSAGSGLIDDDRAALLGRAVLARFPKSAMQAAQEGAANA